MTTATVPRSTVSDVELLMEIVTQRQKGEMSSIQYPNCSPCCGDPTIRVGDIVEVRFEAGPGQPLCSQEATVRRQAPYFTFEVWLHEDRRVISVFRSAMSKTGCQGRCERCAGIARIVARMRELDTLNLDLRCGDVTTEMLRELKVLPPIRIPASPKTPMQALAWRNAISRALESLQKKKGAPTLPWVVHGPEWIARVAIRLRSDYLTGPDSEKAKVIYNELTHHLHEKQELCDALLPPHAASSYSLSP